MVCAELAVGDKPPLTPEEQATRLLIILAVIVAVVLALRVRVI